MKQLPLEGVLVADFTRVLAGPLCTQLLADAGARVIKVEEPSGGDETRKWGPPYLHGVSTYFLSVNRNKESLALDLRSEEGRKVAKALVARADIVVDNFLPSQRKALGLDEVPKGVIHCSIGGFDADTPEVNTPGYDLLAQAGAGMMSITGEHEPAKIGVALSDVLTAHYAHGAILAALYAREQTGKGARLEISIHSATLASLVNVAQSALATGHEARRYGNGHPSIVPYQLFEAADRAFAVGGGTDRHFRMLCERVVERPELADDERFATNGARVTNRDKLVPLLQAIFATAPAEVWVARCRAASIPASLVQGVLEALRGEAARPLVATVEHPAAGTYETVRNPIRYDGERFPIRSAPPLLGEHTAALLRELASAVGKGEERQADGEDEGEQAGHEADVR